MDILRRYEQAKVAAERLRAEEQRRLGSLEEVKRRLKEECSCTSRDQAAKKRKKVEEELIRKEGQLAKLLDDLERHHVPS